MLGDGGPGVADAGLRAAARLKTMLARHQENEVEARPGLAAEASFDDTAEGERLHRYQERWHRSLLRTLAEIEELRDRGPLDHQEMEEAFVGQDSNPVIPFIIEETRLECCPTGGRDVDEGPARSMELNQWRGMSGPMIGSRPMDRRSGPKKSAKTNPPLTNQSGPKKSAKTNPPGSCERW